MTVRQAGLPISNDELKQAAADGAMKRISRQYPATQADMIACRLYPSLRFFLMARVIITTLIYRVTSTRTLPNCIELLKMR